MEAAVLWMMLCDGDGANERVERAAPMKRTGRLHRLSIGEAERERHANVLLHLHKVLTYSYQNQIT